MCACVCIVLRLHIYSSPSKRWPPPWTAAQWTIRLGKKTLLAAVPPGSSRSHFECVFPSAGALDSSLVIICLAWIFYRPLLGIALLILAIAVIVLIVKKVFLRKPKAA